MLKIKQISVLILRLFLACIVMIAAYFISTMLIDTTNVTMTEEEAGKGRDGTSVRFHSRRLDTLVSHPAVALAWAKTHRHCDAHSFQHGNIDVTDRNTLFHQRRTDGNG